MKPRTLMNAQGLFITGMGDNGITAGANADVQPHSYADVWVQAIPAWLGDPLSTRAHPSGREGLQQCSTVTPLEGQSMALKHSLGREPVQDPGEK